MIKAIGDRIFIRLDKDTDNSANKIIMDTKYYPRCIGKIESIGNLVTSVKTGDHVLFHIFEFCNYFSKINIKKVALLLLLKLLIVNNFLSQIFIFFI